jgi:hypothetical protein
MTHAQEKTRTGYNEIEVFAPDLHEQFAVAASNMNDRALCFPVTNDAVVELVESVLTSEQLDEHFGPDHHDPTVAQSILHAARLQLESEALERRIHSMRDAYQRRLIHAAASHIPELPSDTRTVARALLRADEEIRTPALKPAMRQIQLNEHVLSTQRMERLGEGMDPLLAEMEEHLQLKRDCYKNDILAAEERTAAARHVFDHALKKWCEIDDWLRNDLVEDFEVARERVDPRDFQNHLEAADAHVRAQAHAREKELLRGVQMVRARVRDRSKTQLPRYASLSSFRRAHHGRTGKRPQSLQVDRRLEGQLASYVAIGDSLHAVVESDQSFVQVPVADRSVEKGKSVTVVQENGQTHLQVAQERPALAR